MKKEEKAAASPSQLIDQRIKELADWRGETLARVRKIIKEADPEVVETWKWRGVPVWEHAGIICTGETYKAVVKLTFAKGAALDDPSRLFNSSLEGNVRRAIDIQRRRQDRRKGVEGAHPRGGDFEHGGEEAEESLRRSALRSFPASALDAPPQTPGGRSACRNRR